MFQVEITIAPAIGGFVVTYPRAGADGEPEYVQEVVTTVGKAMRVARAATEAFSLVTKSKDDVEA